MRFQLIAFSIAQRSVSPARYRRQERDLVTIGKDAIPTREFAVDRHAQTFVAEREAMPLAQLRVQRTCIGGRCHAFLAFATGRIAQ
jgi:hypothetical protein